MKRTGEKFLVTLATARRCNGPMASYREPLIYLNVLPRNRISIPKALCWLAGWQLAPLSHACKARLGKRLRLSFGDLPSLGPTKSCYRPRQGYAESPRWKTACQI